MLYYPMSQISCGGIDDDLKATVEFLKKENNSVTRIYCIFEMLISKQMKNGWTNDWTYVEDVKEHLSISPQ